MGITRSKFGLYLSYSNCDEDMNVQAMSEYLASDMLNDNALCDKQTFDMDLDTYADELKRALLYQNSDDVQNELKQRTDNIIVSASALNKYLNCPREYYYANILDVPVFADDVDNLSFGAAVHFALEKWQE